MSKQTRYQIKGSLKRGEKGEEKNLRPFSYSHFTAACTQEVPPSHL